MGFLHQLQLLLWKNVTLKRRSPASAVATTDECLPPGRPRRLGQTHQALSCGLSREGWAVPQFPFLECGLPFPVRWIGFVLALLAGVVTERPWWGPAASPVGLGGGFVCRGGSGPALPACNQMPLWRLPPVSQAAPPPPPLLHRRHHSNREAARPALQSGRSPEEQGPSGREAVAQGRGNAPGEVCPKARALAWSRQWGGRDHGGGGAAVAFKTPSPRAAAVGGPAGAPGAAGILSACTNRLPSMASLLHRGTPDLCGHPAVMQSLCPDGQRVEFGFLQYANSTVTQLLERLSRVVEEGNLFDPAQPSLGLELEALRQHLEALSSGPSAWGSHLDRPAVPSFSLDSVARDPQELGRFLVQNLSLPNGTAQALLAARVDPSEVHRLLFGPTPVLDRESWSPPGGDPSFRVEELVLAPARLERLTCALGPGEPGRILTVPEGQRTALRGYRDNGPAAGGPRRGPGTSRGWPPRSGTTWTWPGSLGSWAWTPPTARTPRRGPRPHGACRLFWGTCWTRRRSCRTWTCCPPWLCCCPRAPAPAGAPGASPAGGHGGGGNGTGSNATAEEAAAPAAPDTLQAGSWRRRT
ncbi:ATP-binding cassette sub-family A member 2-like [Perognathus longimembris pacificus]|uniref:ATP-binding cassette sub-family A member 2-like n=1 Tax=Perognathus longimembris pacificus TaxID=214514 RepID=UPI0020193066|nr:ATP-binding cassette sub-family A member 2-like [Perognathus longimembris pacificus]